MKAVNRSTLAPVVGIASVIAAGSASAAPTEVLTAIATAQTDGVLVATAVTVMIFMFAAAKWLRRAK